MPDQLQTLKVPCRGGLDTNRDVLAQAEHLFHPLLTIALL